MATILEHPKAQALLEQAEVSPATVRRCEARLAGFLERYLPLFYRAEHRGHAATILKGKLTALPRKTTEPIATQAQRKRRPLQHFVGAGSWDDDTPLAELRRHVRQELADPNGVLIVDGHGTPKKGDDSCGVARQWCGHLGKVDNCQVSYFVAYAARRGKALLQGRLYLPADRVAEASHRLKTYVPPEVSFHEGWRIALDLLDQHRVALPHAWVTGDDEFGRASVFRARLRLRRERYVLDVPCNTLVRDRSQGRPPSRPGGPARRPSFERADAWVARQPKGRWRKLHVRDGEKGPLQVRACQQGVQTRDEDGCVGPRERLVVIQSCEKKPRTWYTLSNARDEVPLVAVVRAHGERHRMEELLQEGQGEVGLDHYEVRSWVGWHHHITLTLLALWLLQLEKLRVGKKKSARDGAASAAAVHTTAAAATAQRA
jgi:SRSO17 transposase